MVPAWTVLIPAALVLTYAVLAFETRPRALGLIAGLCLLGAGLLLILGVLHW